MIKLLKKHKRFFLPIKNVLNKKGSFTVFAVMAFCSMMIFLIAVITSSRNMAVESAVNSLGNLWSKNILSEYDLVLKDRYGLLAFYGDEVSVEKKIDMYMDYSLAQKEYIDYEVVECNLDDYRLTSTANLKNQIERIVAEGFIPLPRAEDSGEHYTETTVTENTGDELTPKARYINSQWIIKSLPSYNKTEEVYIFGLIKKIKAGMGIESMIENAAVDKYIFDFFTDCMQESNQNENYFSCEVEYILTGKLDDNKAKKETDKKIKLMRNMLNLYYLYSCPEKRDGAMTVASLITPGEAAILTQAAILDGWAWAEAENDSKLLNENRRVPLLKTDENWALSLENVFNLDTGDAVGLKENDKVLQNTKDIVGVVEPKANEGQTYADYLRILLCGLPEETKLLRIMDLIQINMKFTYCDYFLLEDYNCGLSYIVKVNGKKHEFKDKY